MDAIIKINFGKQKKTQTKLRIHDVILKAALRYGSEVCVLNRERERERESVFGSGTDEMFNATAKIYQIGAPKNTDTRFKVQNVMEDIADGKSSSWMLFAGPEAWNPGCVNDKTVYGSVVSGYLYGVVYKVTHAPRPFLIYCVSPSEF